MELLINKQPMIINNTSNCFFFIRFTRESSLNGTLCDLSVTFNSSRVIALLLLTEAYIQANKYVHGHQLTNGWLFIRMTSKCQIQFTESAARYRISGLPITHHYKRLLQQATCQQQVLKQQTNSLFVYVQFLCNSRDVQQLKKINF